MEPRYNDASLRLLSLVSGFPEPKRSQRWLLMLQAFCDESLENDAGLFVMAGYVAPVQSWLKFSDEWQAVLSLDQKPFRPMTRFKMSEMNHERGLRRAELFYRAIERHALAAFSVRIDVGAMRRAMVMAKWPVDLEKVHPMSKPYYFAFRLIVNSLAKHQENLGLNEPVDFVFDEHTSSKYCSPSWDAVKRQAEPDVAKYMGAPPIFRKEEDFLPLQAADLYAWWVRKWAISGVEWEGVENQSFAWKTSRFIPRFHMIFTEEEFLSAYEEELKELKDRFPEDADALSDAIPEDHWGKTKQSRRPA